MKKYIVASVVALTVALVGASAVNAAFMTNLTVGSTGADVSALQSWLISKGFAIPSISSGAAVPGYFGQQTKAAVIAYQASVGLPATGYVGPLTRGILNAGGVATTPTSVACPVGYVCTPTPGTTPVTPVTPTGPLAGTDGSISDVNVLSQYNNEEVGDGENDVKVLGFEVEASNDGDIALKSIKIALDPTGNVGSDHLDDYIDSVSIWKGSTKVGAASADDFTQAGSSDIYTKTITLTSSVVRADATEKFYVTVDAVNNLDSTDILNANDSWTVDVDNIRFEDGSGVVTTDDSTGDINDMNVGISFVSFSTAADTELKITKDTSASPVAGIVVIDDQNDTDNVVLLVGKIKLEGTSDAVIDEFPVTLGSSGTGVAHITNNLKLVLGSEEFSETVSSTTASLSGAGTAGTITFDNLDFAIKAGATVTFKVIADINDIETGTFDEGDALLASVTATNRDYIDVENEEGDQLSDTSEKSGTATGEGQEFRTEGIGLVLVSTATDATTGTSANDDVGLFTIKYKVVAIGDTVYVSSLTGSTGTSFTVDKSGTATTATTINGALVNNTDTTLTTVGNYEISEGDSETFTLTISVPNGAGTGAGSGQYRAALAGVKWATSDLLTLTNNYTSELDTFKTDYKVLN